MPRPNRRELAAEDARRRILTAAADCIVRDGLARVTMSSIAREAGVSSGLLHYHFDTKEGLFADVLRHSGEVSLSVTGGALHRAGDRPAVRLWAFLDRCLPSDEKLTHEWLLWQELDLLCMRNPELAEVSAALYETLYANAEAILAAGVAAGDFDVPPDDVRAVAEACIGLCDGIGSRVLTPVADLTVDQARACVALAAGRLVGYDGPLPLSRTLAAEDAR